MNPIDVLAALVGRWAGTSTLHVSPDHPPDTSRSVLVVAPVAGGRFVRLDYDWLYQGARQDGSLLVGCADGTVTAYWVDSWHMGRAAMLCTGPAAADPLTVRGTYPAPPGPDWGWRIDLTPGAGMLGLVMFNVSPAEQGGKEELAVEATFLPAP